MEAPHQNTTTAATTMVANFVISTLNSLLPALLSYAIEFAKLIPSIATHLFKYFNGVCAYLLASLDEIFPPEKRIQTLHYFLITAKLYFNYLLAKFDEVYPHVKRFILIKFEDSIRFSESWFAYLVTKFDEIYPHVKRYALMKLDDSIRNSESWYAYLVTKFDEIYPHVKRYVLMKLEDMIRISESWFAYLVTKFDDLLPPGERNEALWKYLEAGKQYAAIVSENWVTVCVAVAIGCICLRLCWCGRRTSKTMKAPGRGGATMRRSDFEGSPRNYFRSLRSRRKLLC